MTDNGDALLARLKRARAFAADEVAGAWSTEDAVAFAESEVSLARKEERKLCVKAVCPACRGEQSPIRSEVVDEIPVKLDGKWMHKYTYDAPEVLFRRYGHECHAATIHEHSREEGR